jgi:hypothetical protein
LLLCKFLVSLLFPPFSFALSSLLFPIHRPSTSHHSPAPSALHHHTPLRCDGPCGGWYHARCVNLTAEEAKRISSATDEKWMCPACSGAKNFKSNAAHLGAALDGDYDDDDELDALADDDAPLQAPAASAHSSSSSSSSSSAGGGGRSRGGSHQQHQQQQQRSRGAHSGSLSSSSSASAHGGGSASGGGNNGNRPRMGPFAAALLAAQYQQQHGNHHHGNHHHHHQNSSSHHLPGQPIDLVVSIDDECDWFPLDAHLRCAVSQRVELRVNHLHCSKANGADASGRSYQAIC